MRNLNMLNRYRLTKKELELYGCNGDQGNGFLKYKLAQNGSLL